MDKLKEFAKRFNQGEMQLYSRDTPVDYLRYQHKDYRGYFNITLDGEQLKIRHNTDDNYEQIEVLVDFNIGRREFYSVCKQLNDTRRKRMCNIQWSDMEINLYDSSIDEIIAYFQYLKVKYNNHIRLDVEDCTYCSYDIESEADYQNRIIEEDMEQLEYEERVRQVKEKEKIEEKQKIMDELNELNNRQAELSKKLAEY